ncbi:MAG: hypothetical protein OEM60_05955 [Gammaproteobacteria bacterium]|nr:hypothetical protein [Gammaproteobacteria bacterium]MDH3433380.1 hypothetical protein [Gammaproteobacteria bacterium]
MNRYTLTLGAIVLLTLFGRPAVADDSCSVRAIAGNWLFATSIGRQMLGGPFPPDKDITAIGTMNIAHDGTLSGTFDVTVEDFAFLPGVTYTGSVTVNPDCTGTLSFATSADSVRTDSIAVVSRREMLGMSQDFLNLWTYQIRRVPANLRSGGHDD